MGQKSNPIGLRLGINKTWDSRWFADKTYATFLHEDFKIRAFLEKHLKQAGLAYIRIERTANKIIVNVGAARPGVIIGKSGVNIEKVKKDLAKICNSEIGLNIAEIRKPELQSKLIAENVAAQLEKRVSFRRAMKRVVQSALRLGALGIRINVSGRLGGAEIARMEWYREGRVPLHTLRADVDYGVADAHTTYGVIGIKVWVYKGDILSHDPLAQDRKSADQKVLEK